MVTRQIALLASNVISLPLNIVLSALLLRFLGVADFGYVAWLSAIFLLLGNIFLETLQSFTLAGQQHTNVVQQLIGKKTALTVLACISIAQFTWALTWAGHYPVANLCIVAAVIVLSMGFSGIVWAELRNQEDYLVPNVINRIVQICSLLGGVCLLYLLDKMNVHSTLAIYAFTSSFIALLLIAYQPKLNDPQRWRPTKKLISYFKDSIVTISAPQVTLILPGFFIASEMLAVIRIALQLTNVSLILPTSIYYIYVPRLVRSVKQANIPEYWKITRSVRFWGCLLLIVAIVSAVLLKPVTAYIFDGVDIHLTYNVFLLLAVGNLLAAFYGPSNQVLSLAGYVEYNFGLMLAAVSVLIVSGVCLMWVGLDVNYFIILTSLSTVAVKIIAYKKLKQTITS